MTLRQPLVLAAIGLLVLALVLRLQHHRHSGVVADPVRTPGVLNPDVAQANIGETICKHGWTRTVRPPVEYTNALKRNQLPAYREHGSPSGYQEDHLISLELGGNPTDPRNLWPEPYPRAAAVDRLENQLNGQVCSGALSLAAAQRKETELKHDYG